MEGNNESDLERIKRIAGRTEAGGRDCRYAATEFAGGMCEDGQNALMGSETGDCPGRIKEQKPEYREGRNEKYRQEKGEGVSWII